MSKLSEPISIYIILITFQVDKVAFPKQTHYAMKFLRAILMPRRSRRCHESKALWIQ